MFALPQMVVLPTLSGITVATFEWPALAAVFTWFMVLGLLGCVVGILREGSAGDPVGPAMRATGERPAPLRRLQIHAGHHVDREAA